MKKILFFTILLALIFIPAGPGFCIYCQGGTPCASDGDCYAGCRCLHPPYQEGICVQE